MILESLSRKARYRFEWWRLIASMLPGWLAGLHGIVARQIMGRTGFSSEHPVLAGLVFLGAVCVGLAGNWMVLALVRWLFPVGERPEGRSGGIWAFHREGRVPRMDLQFACSDWIRLDEVRVEVSREGLRFNGRDVRAEEIIEATVRRDGSALLSLTTQESTHHLRFRADDYSPTLWPFDVVEGRFYSRWWSRAEVAFFLAVLLLVDATWPS